MLSKRLHAWLGLIAAVCVTGVERQPVEGSLIGAGPGWLVAKYIDVLRYYTLP